MTVDAIEISVILPTRNGERTIARQLEALSHQVTDVLWELLVVDNGSTDSTRRIVAEFASPHLPVRIVDASSSAGLSYARNRGVEAATGRFVAFCDDDDEVDSKWLQQLVTALRDHPFVASQMEYHSLNCNRTMLGRAHFQERSLGSLFGYDVVNGAIGIERELWLSVGGNDESLRSTGEDFDFAIRVQQDTGVRPRLAEGATYHYRQRSGFRASFRQGRAYGRAHVMLYRRHGRGRVELGVERRRAVRDWLWLASRGAAHMIRGSRDAWARRLGLRVGRLQGSVEQRCWYP